MEKTVITKSQSNKKKSLSKKTIKIFQLFFSNLNVQIMTGFHYGE